MIVLGDAILSDDIRERMFVCDLEKCKGACCVEGDLGAPLEESELETMKDIQDQVRPYLTEEGRKAIDDQGPYILDEDNEYSTPTLNGKECAYAVYDENQILKCGIEQAYNDGKIDFQKPVSCHLYPVRVKKYEEIYGVNYDEWKICDPACTLGESLKVPLYKFVRDGLIRKFGREWYEKLVKLIEG